jgi:serine/threonine-protein kinase
MLEQEHAMKVLYGDLSQDLRVVERFKREAKAISMMRHPNLLSVNDFGRTHDGLTFLVMELVRGVTLEEEIFAGAPFSIERAARIVEQVAAGLGEAHSRGFVHRDVKPSNIMLSADRGLEHVKILDFGIVGLRTEVE